MVQTDCWYTFELDKHIFAIVGFSGNGRNEKENDNVFKIVDRNKM